jgi:hypothetical protein
VVDLTSVLRFFIYLVIGGVGVHGGWFCGFGVLYFGSIWADVGLFSIKYSICRLNGYRFFEVC